MARRLLANRAKITAPARNDDPVDRAAASKTFLSFASVRSMVLLIISRLPFRVDKIGNRRPAHLYCFPQNFLQRPP